MLTTASDMLFSGARDGSFFALDARTGKLLWQTNLGPSVAAGPMTYAVNGKQYVEHRRRELDVHVSVCESLRLLLPTACGSARPLQRFVRATARALARLALGDSPRCAA